MPINKALREKRVNSENLPGQVLIEGTGDRLENGRVGFPLTGFFRDALTPNAGGASSGSQELGVLGDKL